MKFEKVSAVVLAGGNSTRMGQNKALLKIGSKTLIEMVVDTLGEIFSEIIVVTNNPDNYPMLKNVQFQLDCMKTPVKNSLVGIYTGLLKATNDYAFVVACDMPFLNVDVIKYMLSEIGDEDAVVPFIEGHYQPLHAIYNKTCLGFIKNALNIENYKIIDLYNTINTTKVYEEEISKIDINLRGFMNVNTKDIYYNLNKNLTGKTK